MKEFREEQRFTQIFVWVILIAPMVMVLSQFVMVLTDDKGIQDEDIITLISISIIFTGLIVWFRRLVLQTSVTEQGIKIHYRGLFTKKNFPKADILKAELVTYDPLWNYGGWGLRYSSKRGWCYNVAGDKGLKLTMSNGKVVMIGTQKTDELNSALTSMHYPV